MVAYNVSRIARGAQSTMEDYGSEAEAIRSGLNPMLRDIEVQSGMVSGANVLPNRLFTNAPQATALATYYDALANKLPGYVNARRAYDDAEKKKTTSSSGTGTGTGMMTDAGYSPIAGLPPIAEYLPGVPNVGKARTQALYKQLSQALLAQSRGKQPVARTIPTPGRMATR